jgi:mannose/fructose/N-acetylgalactosamine-specific phosphotransferase system component IIC
MSRGEPHAPGLSWGLFGGVGLDQTLWLSALGAVLALDQAVVGQFMLSQPLIVSTLFGWLLGDLTTGLFAGAMMQLLWSNVLPVGAYIPSDHSVSAGIATVLAIHLPHDGFSGPTALVLALAVSIPAGWVSGRLDVLVRHGNSWLARQAEQWINRYGGRGLAVINLSGLVTMFARNFLVYAVWLGLVAPWLDKLQTSAFLLRGLGLAGLFLPALSLAVAWDAVGKNGSLVLAGLSLGCAGLGLWAWPQAGPVLVAMALAASAVLMARKEPAT